MGKKALKVIWIIWMVVYNVVFIWFLVRYQATGNPFVGVFPITFVVYLVWLTAVSVVNWIIGWQFVKPERPQGQTTRE